MLKGHVPPRPPELSARAAAEWERLAPQMAEAGLLHDRFLMAFVGYCECVSEYWSHKATVAKSGYTLVTEKGNLIQHPAVGMMGKCLDRMVKLERELGLTPASATGLQPGSEGEVDPLEALQQKLAEIDLNPPPAPPKAATKAKPAAKLKAATKSKSKRTSKR